MLHHAPYASDMHMSAPSGYMSCRHLSQLSYQRCLHGLSTSKWQDPCANYDVIIPFFGRRFGKNCCYMTFVVLPASILSMTMRQMLDHLNPWHDLDRSRLVNEA